LDLIELTPALKLLLVGILFAIGIFNFLREREKWGLAFLFLGALCLRLVMISFDPFLHDWDERFHALVAKHMMDNPWVPMLREHPVLVYDYKAWCCNHIWVHKQPLFMWQMALSMKVFGVNEIAMRLPSALLGAIAPLFVFRIGQLWLHNKKVAYLGALFFALSFYQLELTSGNFSLDHNDLVYAFYVLASFWAYTEYRNQLDKPIKWLLLIGLFVGCAVLNKWLTGLLVFAGWGSMLLFTPYERVRLSNWLHMCLALLVAVVVFLPWQIYTANAFPLETAWEQHFNYLHIIEPLDGHAGGSFFHLIYMYKHYGVALLPFLALGLVLLIAKGWLKRPYTIEMLSMFVFIYVFFSQVQTKMPAFTFVVAPIGFLIVAYALVQIGYRLKQTGTRYGQAFFGLLVVFVLVMGFRPWSIEQYRSEKKVGRNQKINNTQIYKEVGAELPPDYLVFNCKSFEDVEMMFYTDLNAYHWWPIETVLDSLLDAGHKIAIFKSHGGQVLPPSVANNPRILIIDKQLL
jgi:4-amino-4-deoxy-L-arabinose transferase